MEGATIDDELRSNARAVRRSRIGVFVLVGASIAGAAAAVAACRSMPAMGELPMPGGWTISAIWTPACGETWPGAAIAFVRMWTVMMAAMMLPSAAIDCGRLWLRPSAGGLFATAWPVLLSVAFYLLGWAGAGMAAFVLGDAAATLMPHAAGLARLVPLGSGVLTVIAGVMQFTPWKQHSLAFCASSFAHGPAGAKAIGAVAACKRGLALTIRDGYGCANLMAVLFAVGITDSRAMAAITVAMSLERLAPARLRVARCIGVTVVAMGMWMVGRAAHGG